MQHVHSLTPSSRSIATPVQVGVYECEVRLKFRIIEEGNLPTDRAELLAMLLEAYGYGTDEYLESLQVEVRAEAIEEVSASPKMRRQLIRLRNSKELV